MGTFCPVYISFSHQRREAVHHTPLRGATHKRRLEEYIGITAEKLISSPQSRSVERPSSSVNTCTEQGFLHVRPCGAPICSTPVAARGLQRRVASLHSATERPDGVLTDLSIIRRGT
ncbi:hypothetical protein E2C01_082385 [Portunus trituberculatus]|uniref:Uncharacterized protein n=1 Tax=Portunus trituberculatus TaxID=210409 RepID=A0A5B7IUE8_PORTR|nr:hypothetical protein [Portunus trituberculatus]